MPICKVKSILPLPLHDSQLRTELFELLNQYNMTLHSTTYTKNDDETLTIKAIIRTKNNISIDEVALFIQKKSSGSIIFHYQYVTQLNSLHEHNTAPVLAIT